MSRRNPKHKNSSGRFARLPVSVLEHVAVTTLSHAAFRVLVLLAAAFSGYNNGQLGLTASQAAKLGIGSDKTLYRALRDLEGRSLIALTYPASRVPPRPTMWALAWLPVDETQFSRATKTPSHAYRDWKPKRCAA
jgi:hypothetical protein